MWNRNHRHRILNPNGLDGPLSALAHRQPREWLGGRHFDPIHSVLVREPTVKNMMNEFVFKKLYSWKGLYLKVSIPAVIVIAELFTTGH